MIRSFRFSLRLALIAALFVFLTGSSPTTPSTHAGQHPAADAMSSTKALQVLTEGNARFVTGKPRHPGDLMRRRGELTSGQAPHTIILSCSDSRVPPENVFDQGLGQLFVVRSAGHTIDSSAIASIEYAVAHLGSRLLVVLGHTSCGAIKATLGVMAGAKSESSHLGQLVGKTKPHLVNVKDKDSKSLVAHAMANAQGAAKELVARSNIIKAKVEEHQLDIKTAVYDLETGEVKYFE